MQHIYWIVGGVAASLVAAFCFIGAVQTRPHAPAPTPAHQEPELVEAPKPFVITATMTDIRGHTRTANLQECGIYWKAGSSTEMEQVCNDRRFFSADAAALALPEAIASWRIEVREQPEAIASWRIEVREQPETPAPSQHG
jgi:hypothetical protein